ncbi:unnamed protein product [Pylaiella littoralis]
MAELAELTVSFLSLGPIAPSGDRTRLSSAARSAASSTSRGSSIRLTSEARRTLSSSSRMKSARGNGHTGWQRQQWQDLEGPLEGSQGNESDDRPHPQPHRLSHPKFAPTKPFGSSSVEGRSPKQPAAAPRGPSELE